MNCHPIAPYDSMLQAPRLSHYFLLQKLQWVVSSSPLRSPAERPTIYFVFFVSRQFFPFFKNIFIFKCKKAHPSHNKVGGIGLFDRSLILGTPKGQRLPLSVCLSVTIIGSGFIKSSLFCKSFYFISLLLYMVIVA